VVRNAVLRALKEERGPHEHAHLHRGQHRRAPAAGSGSAGGVLLGLQALKLFPLENQTAQKALDDLHRAATRVVEREGEVEIGLVGDFIFINDVRIRLDLSTFAAFSLVSIVAPAPRDRDHQHRPGARALGVAALPVAPAAGEAGDASRGHVPGLHSRLGNTPVRTSLGPERDARRRGLDDAVSKEAAKRAYFQTVEVAKNVLGRYAAGEVGERPAGEAGGAVHRGPGPQQRDLHHGHDRAARLRRLHVHPLRERVHLQRGAGPEAGADKLQLYELGLGALFHDLGKMRIDRRSPTSPAADRRGVRPDAAAHHRGAAGAVRHARVQRAAVPGHAHGLRAPHEGGPDRVPQEQADAGPHAVQPDRGTWPTASTRPPASAATRRCRGGRRTRSRRCGTTPKPRLRPSCWSRRSST
jgi:hypothetical protein